MYGFIRDPGELAKLTVMSALGSRALRVALLSGAVSTLFAGRAVAGDEIQVSLDYGTAPDLVDCPSAVDFQKEVTRQLRRDPFRDDAPRRLGVRIFASGGRMGGRIEWHDAEGEWEGERTFSSRNESCAAMARTVELATAIQIELLATLGRAPEPKPEPNGPDEEQPPPSPVKAMVQDANQMAPPVPKEPFFGVSLGIGVIGDLGNAPSFAVPRLSVLVGRPRVLAVRVAASGLGPGTEVSGLEGTAQLDRFVGTLDAIRSFRTDRRIQPLVTAGIGVQDVRIRGTSAMPSLAAAHDGQRVSGLVTTGVGVGVALARRLSFVLEGDALFFRPAVTVKIGSSTSAYMDGVAIFIQGGLLARF